MSMMPSGPGLAAPPTQDGGRVPVHVAVVQSGGRICHLVADTSSDGLTRQLAEYVRHSAGYQLWPRDSDRVASLLSSGHAEEAVELYFARTGERWDREELVVRPVLLSIEAHPEGGAA